jgi:hypothetical protein
MVDSSVPPVIKDAWRLPGPRKGAAGGEAPGRMVEGDQVACGEDGVDAEVGS